MKSLALPATLESLTALLEFVEREAKACGLTGAARMEVLLAAEELIVNVISYAYSEGAPGEVRLEAEKPAGRAGLLLRIMDRGRPFDPLSLREPDLAVGVEERRIGGLGVFLARRKSDRLTYARTGDANVLTVEKWAAPAGKAAGKGGGS
jgi:Anti-sigma regulatory factor (Ser/Thr protein kinase)